MMVDRDVTPPPAFGTIVIDYPWFEPGGCNRGTKYRTFRRVEDGLPVIFGSPAWRPAETCHLYVWKTVTHNKEAMWLLEALAFRYVTEEVWLKTSRGGKRLRGMGQYRRQCCEFTLIGVRGPTFLPSSEVCHDSVYEAPPGRHETHSAKPDAFYERAMSASPGPFVDMFARRRRPGWWTWGDELGPELQPPAEPVDLDQPLIALMQVGGEPRPTARRNHDR